MAPGVNLVMTVIGFTVSTMFIVFVCARLIWGRIHYLSARRSSGLSSTSDPGVVERGLRRVTIGPLIVSNLPTKKYSNPFFSCAVDAQCTICLSKFLPEDTLRILPFCGHFFHSTCIDIWLHQHCTCPVCRVSIHDLSQREHAMQMMSSSATRYSSTSHNNHWINVNSQVRSTQNEPEAAQTT